MKNVGTVIAIAKDHYKLIKGLEIKLIVNEYRFLKNQQVSGAEPSLSSPLKGPVAGAPTPINMILS